MKKVNLSINVPSASDIANGAKNGVTSLVPPAAISLGKLGLKALANVGTRIGKGVVAAAKG